MGTRARSLMSPKAYDILWYRLPFGLSNDIRPCVIVQIESDGTATLLRISSAMQLYNYQTHFRFDPSHENFHATGLKKESFCDDSKFFSIPCGSLPDAIGTIEGRLRKEFDDWLGL